MHRSSLSSHIIYSFFICLLSLIKFSFCNELYNLFSWPYKKCSLPVLYRYHKGAPETKWKMKHKLCIPFSSFHFDKHLSHGWGWTEFNITCSVWPIRWKRKEVMCKFKKRVTYWSKNPKNINCMRGIGPPRTTRTTSMYHSNGFTSLWNSPGGMNTIFLMDIPSLGVFMILVQSSLSSQHFQ